MSRVVGDNYPRNISQYVPDMEFAADVVQDSVIVSLGAPATLDADGIWDGIAAGASASSGTSADFKNTFDGSSTSLTSTVGMIDASYGRALTLVGSAGADHVITITGRDYLGQLMVETLTANATTAVAGTKAFKFVDSYSIAAGGQAGDTLDIGWGNVLGVPYKAELLLSDTEDKVAAAGALTAGISTDPQTATTGDPRGTFAPATACDGSIVYELRYVCDTSDLHGVEHFSG